MWVLAALGLLLVAGHAWVSEDAYITFRVVDNFVSGHGLRWNVDERVEVFTNPLWLLLHIPIRSAGSNLFLTTIILSIVCSATSVVVAARSSHRRSLLVAVLLLLPLVLSKSFIEFSTSGLENPLSFLLVALFFWSLLRKGRVPRRTPWFSLSLIAALSCVNRLDTILIFLPVMTYLVLSRRRTVRWGLLFAGALPLVLWKAFALVYYGFPFPNTAYAKLDTGVGRLVYGEQGLFYLFDLARRDMSALLVIGSVGVITAVLFARRRRERAFRGDTGVLAYLGLGVALYVVYVICIGGDFMSCRLWSLPFFVSVLVLFRLAPPSISLRSLVFIASILLLTKAATLWTEPKEHMEGASRQKSWHGIVDERLGYSGGQAFFSPGRAKRFRFSLPPFEHSSSRAIMWYSAGVKPYTSGPAVLVVDGLALGDPLLARLPALPREGISIGHFKRGIPKGYLEARLSGDLDWLNPHLRQYYEKLQIITGGDLFSSERLSTILRFNLGAFNASRAAYLASADPYVSVEDGHYIFYADSPEAEEYQRGLEAKLLKPDGRTPE